MMKVKILVLNCALISIALAAVTSRDPYKNPPNRRIESIKNLTQVDKFYDALYTKNDFFDNLYNTKTKPHNIGADYQLTSNVYRLPNPFYNKKPTNDEAEDKNSVKFWYPVYNNNNENNQTIDTDSPDTTASSSSHSVESFNSVPLKYDAKTNTYSTYYTPSYPANSGSHYGAPPPPPPTYLPLPSPMPTYGPAGYTPSYSYAYVPQPYGISTSSSHEDKKSHESWFLEKLFKKFDLVLMSKLLLKFIIFKKIVKFIAIICILLFLPALKKKFVEVAEDVSSEDRSEEGDEERKGRNFKFLDAYANLDFQVREIANFALTAIEGFESHQIPWCVGESEFYCRFQYMLDQIDFRYPLVKISSIWFPALATTEIPPPAPTTKRSVNYNDFITESPLDSSSSIEVDNELSLI